MRVHDLSPLTRRVNQNRRVVIQGFDLPFRAFVVFLVALAPAAAAGAVLWAFIGFYGIFAFVGVEVAAFWLIEVRSSHGLRLRTYQSIMDTQRARVGRFSCCGAEMNPLGSGFGRIILSSLPVTPHQPPGDASPFHTSPVVERNGTNRSEPPAPAAWTETEE